MNKVGIPPFQSNKVVQFWTSYKGEGKYRNFRENHYYLLFSVDKTTRVLTFFPITSNRHCYKKYVSRYKISSPRPPCLESKKYPESFVNTGILVTVPFEVITYLDFCNQCPSPFCLQEDFGEIVQLHSALPKVDTVNLNIKDFKKG